MAQFDHKTPRQDDVAVGGKTCTNPRSAQQEVEAVLRDIVSRWEYSAKPNEMCMHAIYVGSCGKK